MSWRTCGLVLSLASVLTASAACGGSARTPPPGPPAGYARSERADEAAKAAADDALAATEPGAVQPKDRKAYFDALTRYVRRTSYGRSQSETGAPKEPDPEVLRKVLVLEPLASGDPALAAPIQDSSVASLPRRIHEWLFKRGDDFLQAYAFEPAKVLSPESSRWHQAEAAWVAWVGRQLPTVNEVDAQTLTYYMGQSRRDGVPQFPGLDRFAVGLAIVDLWVRLGHPEVDRGRPFESVVCQVNNNYGKLSSWCGGGEGWWYAEALATDQSAHRLARVVLERKDPLLTVSVSLGIGTSPRTLVVLNDFEQDPTIWRDALLAISRGEDQGFLRDWLIPDLRRVWKSRPAWRPVILYALAQASGEYADEQHEEHGLVGFGHFSQQFEGGVSRGDFAAFLQQAPRALELARWLLPARTKGWSVADVVLPQLDAYFALPRDAWAPRAPGFASLVGYLCYREHDLAGLAKLRAYFEKRAPSHPGDPLNAMMDHYGPKECRGHR
jgi:hypothetical protein